MTRIKTISILLLLVMIIIAVIPLNAYAVNKDYAGHWAETTIQTWLDNNYVSGYPDGSFKPDEPITRAEFITLVNNLLGYTETADISFTDVNPNDWYYQEVQKAYKAGYISGVSESRFAPNNNITREQAAVIVSKILGLEINSSNVQAFTDGNLISEWAKDYVNAAAVAQIILGYSEDNTFRPQNPITRAEAIVLLERLNQFIIEDIVVPEGTIILPSIVDGGGDPGPGPVDPIKDTIDISIINSIVTLGINEEYNLANNLTLKTPEVTLTYTTDNVNGVIDDPLNGVITGKTQGKVNITVKASKSGYDDKTVKFQVVVAPLKLSWTDPSGNKLEGQKQDIKIDISLLEGVDEVTNIAVNMVWEKYVASDWIAVDDEDITLTHDSKEVEMFDGIYQLINGITVDKDTSITTVVLFNNVGEYKFTVYCMEE